MDKNENKSHGVSGIERITRKLTDLAVAFEMHVPDIDPDLILLNREIPKYLAPALESHTKFRSEIDPGGTSAIKAQKEVEAIRLFFPQVKCNTSIVCMAAWLATLCAIDDAIEAMLPTEAEEILEESIQMFQTDSVAPNGIQRSQVMQILAKFKTHSAKFLPKEIFDPVIEDVILVLRGLSREIHFNLNPSDIDVYLDIRTLTIGVKVFFALLLGSQGRTFATTPALLDIQNDVSRITGLQNDLLGLEKDIRNNETNAVLILHQLSVSFDQGLKMLSDQHNALVTQVTQKVGDMRRDWKSCPVVETQMAFARWQLLFTRTHFEWCASADRYK